MQLAVKRFTFAVKETLITVPAGEKPPLLLLLPLLDAACPADELYCRAAFISHDQAAGNKAAN